MLFKPDSWYPGVEDTLTLDSVDPVLQKWYLQILCSVAWLDQMTSLLQSPTVAYAALMTRMLQSLTFAYAGLMTSLLQSVTFAYAALSEFLSAPLG